MELLPGNVFKVTPNEPLASGEYALVFRSAGSTGDLLQNVPLNPTPRAPATRTQQPAGIYGATGGGGTPQGQPAPFPFAVWNASARRCSVTKGSERGSVSARYVSAGYRGLHCLGLPGVAVSSPERRKGILMKRTVLFFLIAGVTLSSGFAQIITTIAGTGTAGYSGYGGPANQGQLNQPSQVGVDCRGAPFRPRRAPQGIFPQSPCRPTMKSPFE